MATDSKAFGKSEDNPIRALRKEHSLKADEISEYLGIDKQLYWYYERNPMKVRLDVLIRLADYYGVTVDYLLNRGERGKKPSAREWEYINKIRKMSKEDKKMIHRMINAVSATPDLTKKTLRKHSK